MQSAAHISEIPVILKQSQGHQAYNDNVEGPGKHGFITMRSLKDHALMVSTKKQTLKVFFFKCGNVNYLP